MLANRNTHEVKDNHALYVETLQTIDDLYECKLEVERELADEHDPEIFQQLQCDMADIYHEMNIQQNKLEKLERALLFEHRSVSVLPKVDESTCSSAHDPHNLTNQSAAAELCFAEKSSDSVFVSCGATEVNTNEKTNDAQAAVVAAHKVVSPDDLEDQTQGKLHAKLQLYEHHEDHNERKCEAVEAAVCEFVAKETQAASVSCAGGDADVSYDGAADDASVDCCAEAAKLSKDSAAKSGDCRTAKGGARRAAASKKQPKSLSDMRISCDSVYLGDRTSLHTQMRMQLREAIAKFIADAGSHLPDWISLSCKMVALFGSISRQEIEYTCRTMLSQAWRRCASSMGVRSAAMRKVFSEDLSCEIDSHRMAIRASESILSKERRKLFVRSKKAIDAGEVHTSEAFSQMCKDFASEFVHLTEREIVLRCRLQWYQSLVDFAKANADRKAIQVEHDKCLTNHGIETRPTTRAYNFTEPSADLDEKTLARASEKYEKAVRDYILAADYHFVPTADEVFSACSRVAPVLCDDEKRYICELMCNRYEAQIEQKRNHSIKVNDKSALRNALKRLNDLTEEKNAIAKALQNFLGRLGTIINSMRAAATATTEAVSTAAATAVAATMEALVPEPQANLALANASDTSCAFDTGEPCPDEPNKASGALDAACSQSTLEPDCSQIMASSAPPSGYNKAQNVASETASIDEQVTQDLSASTNIAAPNKEPDNACICAKTEDDFVGDDVNCKCECGAESDSDEREYEMPTVDRPPMTVAEGCPISLSAGDRMVVGALSKRAQNRNHYEQELPNYKPTAPAQSAFEPENQGIAIFACGGDYCAHKQVMSTADIANVRAVVADERAPAMVNDDSYFGDELEQHPKQEPVISHADAIYADASVSARPSQVKESHPFSNFFSHFLK